MVEYVRLESAIMSPLSRSLLGLLRTLLRILLYIFTLAFLVELIAWLRRMIERKQRDERLRDVRHGQPMDCEPKCAAISPDVYKRADPLIYSQIYLMSQGLAVTWDNPDIQLYDGGAPVSSSQLKAGKTYDVVATIYNNSTDAPAVGLPVLFAFRSFGVGATVTGIGSTKIDLPVKGAPGHPAQAKILWTTPNTPGHYCLLVMLVWPDDANPNNNIGQENTDVALAASPAQFQFPVRNEDKIRKRIRMTSDAYVPPNRLHCDQRPSKKQSERRYRERKRLDVYIPPLERDADWVLARVRHGPDAFPIPADWDVLITPAEFELAPGATKTVKVKITPPDAFRGERPFNVNAMDGERLLGGVTLTVRR
jgi:hypothetical protein